MAPKNYLSLIVQGVYGLLAGTQLVFIPNFLLQLFGFEPTSEVWVKVLGIVLMCMSIIYYHLNKYGNREVIFSSVLGRLFASFCFVLLVLSGQAKPTLLLLGAVDTATAIWTWMELKKKGKK